jgi:hypothetical protein
MGEDQRGGFCLRSKVKGGTWLEDSTNVFDFKSPRGPDTKDHQAGHISSTDSGVLSNFPLTSLSLLLTRTDMLLYLLRHGRTD